MKLVCNSVSAFVFRRRGDGVDYLVLRRTAGRGGFWQSVSGSIERGELPEETARREVLEETGLTPRSVVVLEKVHTFFKPGKRRIYFEPCFGVEVGGGEPVLSNEHDGFAWLPFKGAVERVPFAGLKDALRELDDRLSRTVEG